MVPPQIVRRQRFACFFVGVATAWLSLAEIASAQVAHEVVFRVAGNASIDWFEIDNPAVRGTLNVTNAPYDSTASLNAAAVDVSRNRLIFDNDLGTVQGYGINLAGLQLIQNGATPVTVTSLGAWGVGGDNGGYRKADGQVYYHPNNSVQFDRLNFGPSGSITGFTTIGNFTGPTAISAGDIDFSGNGSIWVSGFNAMGLPRLWNFDFTTLNALSTLIVSANYNGITFNAAGDTLYGYTNATGQYGIISTTTGGFQTILDTDTTFFGVTGDLATGTLVIVQVPEPSTLGLVAMATSGAALIGWVRRRWAKGDFIDPSVGI
jgi:hypothetical protein